MVVSKLYTAGELYTVGELCGRGRTVWPWASYVAVGKLCGYETNTDTENNKSLSTPDSNHRLCRGKKLDCSTKATKEVHKTTAILPDC